MSDNLKEWMLYKDIILLSAWFGYGGKTLYNGGTLSIGYLVYIICLGKQRISVLPPYR